MLVLRGMIFSNVFGNSKDCDFRSSPLTADEWAIVEQFHGSYNRDETGRFIVLLLKKANTETLGETRSLAV